MANDPTQDKDFLAAPPERQHAYLMATDPDYANAPPERQKAYLASFAPPPPNLKTGEGMENYAQRKARQVFSGDIYGEGKRDSSGRLTSGPNGEPLTLMQKAVLDQGNQQVDLGAAENRASNSPNPVTKASMVYAAPVATSREALLRGTAAVARTAAGAAGGMYGGGKVGRYIGGRLGDPETGETLGNIIGGAAGGFLGGTGRYMPSKYSLIERLLGSGQPEATSAEAAAVRSLPTTPSEPGVTVVPEPRPALPGDKPASMWSVGRETELPQAAKQGVPGAADVLRNTGRTILFSPREGTGFPGPRSVTSIGDIPQGTPSPFPPVVQSEGAPPPAPTSASPETSAASPVGGSQVPPTMPSTVPQGAVLDRGQPEPWDEAARRGAPGVNPKLRSVNRKFGSDTSKMAEQDEKIRNKAKSEQ